MGDAMDVTMSDAMDVTMDATVDTVTDINGINTEIITTNANNPIQPHQPGPTLLPLHVAQAISFATRSTRLAIRVGSVVGSYSLDAAKFTTLSSLELARTMVEGVLSRAARDGLAHSRTDLAATDTESVLEKSLESLHYAVAQVVFWTSASFSFTDTSLAVASEASQLLLTSFDSLFGSTDSSRAVASIITLVRREFNNPATGVCGEKVGVMDLLLALSALAYLQQHCWRCVDEERRRTSYEEVIWDVVVLNDGERIDVNENGTDYVQANDGRELSSRPVSWHGTEDDEAVLARLKSQIVSSLSPGTSVSVSSSVSAVQTITVDVGGSQLLSLPTPPGAEIVETKVLSPGSTDRPWSSHSQGNDSSYRIVYRIERNKLRTTSYRGENEGSGPTVVEVHGMEGPSTEPGHGSPPDFRQIPQVLRSPPTFHSPDHSPGNRNSHPLSEVPVAPQGLRSPEGNAGGASGKLDRQLPLRKTQGQKPSETTANQKKPRSPLTSGPTKDGLGRRQRGSSVEKRPLSKKKTSSTVPAKSFDKKNGLKQALKGSGQSISSIWNKDAADASGASTKPKPPWNGSDRASGPTSPVTLKPPVPRNLKQPIQSGASDRRPLQNSEPFPRSSSRASYVSVHERRRDSIVSQTDSYSVHSAGGVRPASPTIVRSDFTTQDSIGRSRLDPHSVGSVPPSPHRGHRRTASHVPSLYSMATNDSQTSLMLSSYYQKSAYNATDALATLRREGFVDGTFPAGHLLPNIMRYMRFSSACYGSHFLKFLGISKEMPQLRVWDGTHEDVRHFVHHTESRADNILLASFVDPQGGTDSTGATGTGVPLVHYISLDHEAKAVVLACRGTLGFEDVMTDMTCDYDTLNWRGRGYKVHKGIHASARRLLYGGDGRVLVTLKEALSEFPEYGLVLCGHSLGAGVTSLLGVMISEPNPDGTGFVTSTEPHSRLLTDGASAGDKFSEIRLPAGRRSHVYAYGPPGVMSSPLRKITRGLITSVVHGNDLVPHLSLGVLHDFQAMALAFKRDENQTKAEIRQRMWLALQDNVTDKWYRSKPRAAGEGEAQWMLPVLDGLRASMKCEKLLPPGEVFIVESQRVLRRDAFMLSSEEPIGRPARRVVLKYVRDVEGRFGEIRFGTSMLTDHSPAGYEDSLNKLRLGVNE